MTSQWPIELNDRNGVARLVGKAKGSPPGTVYVPPNAKEVLVGPLLSINDGSFALLAWATDHRGDTVLNLAAPTLPTVITAGIYAIEATVAIPSSDGLSAGGFFVATLQAGPALGPYYRSVSATSSIGDGAPFGSYGPTVALSLTTHLEANESISVAVANEDGALARNFSMKLGVIQKIT